MQRPITTLSELMTERENQNKIIQRQSWETSMMGLIATDIAYDATIKQVLPSTGFIWGKSIWGVDKVDAEKSELASKYSL